MHNFRSYNENKIKIIKEYSKSRISKWKTKRRFKVFYAKGTKCVHCGQEGTRIFKWQNKKNGATHIDLYLENGELMTVDHIVPKSKGGSNELSNLQPMCYKCNAEKGDRMNAKDWLNLFEFILVKEMSVAINQQTMYTGIMNEIQRLKNTCKS